MVRLCRVTLLMLALALCAVASNANTYDSARSSYYNLEAGPDAKDANRWRSVAQEFIAVEHLSPKGARAADALYMAGKCLEFAHRLDNSAKDSSSALFHYKKLYEKHSSSSLADDALFRSARLHENRGEKGAARKLYKKILSSYKGGDMLSLAQKRLTSMDKPTGVVGVRHWSGEEYTRIVIDLTGLQPYSSRALAKDPSNQKPDRVFIDLSNARLKIDGTKTMEVLDGLVSQVRVGQYDSDTVRVVMDLKHAATHRVFPLLAPDRLVIDIFRESGKETGGSDTIAAIIEVVRDGGAKKTPKPAKPFVSAPKPTSRQPAKIARKPLRIVIDPGHGGKDPGAVGYKRLLEKDVTLGISLALARKLTQVMNCEVKLTRETDRWLSLSQRTAIANRFGADLFISVHANASRSKRAMGIETYYLDRSSDRSARKVAAVENKTTVDGVRETEQILADVLLNMKLPESKRLAGNIQKAMLAGVSKRYGKVRDLGIKRAPFYVLTGAAMPAVLLEAGFLTNKSEAKRLKTKEYQTLIADSVASAVVRHSKGL